MAILYGDQVNVKTFLLLMRKWNAVLKPVGLTPRKDIRGDRERKQSQPLPL
jgi:hypothetical protein